MTAGQLQNTDHDRPGKLLTDYAPIMSMYTERDITFPKDGLKAFSGVCKSVEHLFGPFSWGISGRRSDYFLWGLSWSLFGSLRRRNHFPSWTWVGWEYTEETKRKDRRMSHERLEPLGVLCDCLELMSLDQTEEGIRIQPSVTTSSQWREGVTWPKKEHRHPIKGLYISGPWQDFEGRPGAFESARILSMPTFVARIDINKTRFQLNCRPGPLPAKLPLETWFIHFMVIAIRQPEVIILPIEFNGNDISYRIDNPLAIEDHQWLSYKPTACLVHLG
jgi:hypothetical protein